MSAYLRNVAIGIIFLAVIVTGATSCKKQVAETTKHEVEPWPIAAIWAWGDYVAGQDSSAPSLVVYNDGKVILKKVSRFVDDRNSKPSQISTVTFWTSMLSAYELADFQERMMAVLNDPKLEACDEFIDRSGDRFYFGTQGKGFFVDVKGLWLGQPDDEFFLEALAGNTKIPDSLYRYCAYLPSLIQGNLVPWRPDHLVVEFQQSIEDRAKRPHWPDSWPSPESHEAKSCGERRFVVLDIKNQVGLQQLLGTERRDDFMEIEVNGMKYSAGFRYHFPGGESWHSAFGVSDLNSFTQPPVRLPPIPPVPKPIPPKNAFDLR
jgi:hypothetical protein